MKSKTQIADVLDYTKMDNIATNVVIPIQYKEMMRYLSNTTRIRQSGNVHVKRSH